MTTNVKSNYCKVDAINTGSSEVISDSGTQIKYKHPVKSTYTAISEMKAKHHSRSRICCVFSSTLYILKNLQATAHRTHFANIGFQLEPRRKNINCDKLRLQYFDLESMQVQISKVFKASLFEAKDIRPERFFSPSSLTSIKSRC